MAKSPYWIRMARRAKAGGTASAVSHPPTPQPVPTAVAVIANRRDVNAGTTEIKVPNPIERSQVPHETGDPPAPTPEFAIGRFLRRFGMQVWVETSWESLSQQTGFSIASLQAASARLGDEGIARLATITRDFESTSTATLLPPRVDLPSTRGIPPVVRQIVPRISPPMFQRPRTDRRTEDVGPDGRRALGSSSTRVGSGQRSGGSRYTKPPVPGGEGEQRQARHLRTQAREKTKAARDLLPGVIDRAGEVGIPEFEQREVPQADRDLKTVQATPRVDVAKQETKAPLPLIMAGVAVKLFLFP